MISLTRLKLFASSSRTIISHYFQRELHYRASIISFRIGEMLESLFLVLFWIYLYEKGQAVGGMNLSEIVTYVLVGNIAQSVTRVFLIGHISKDIVSGDLSHLLVKPYPYLLFVWMREVGRTSIIWISSFVISIVLAMVFYRYTFLPVELIRLSIILPMLFFALVTEMLIASIIGLMALWFDDVFGFNLTFDRLKKFFSGGYFPLSVFPKSFVSFSFVLPFAYTFFIPMQLYLGKMTIRDGIKGLCIQMGWIIILSFILRFTWNHGIKKYEAVGN